jgi:hypothetical protein
MEFGLFLLHWNNCPSLLFLALALPRVKGQLALLALLDRRRPFNKLGQEVLLECVIDLGAFPLMETECLGKWVQLLLLVRLRHFDLRIDLKDVTR